MYGTSETLDEFVSDIPSIILSKHSTKFTGGNLNTHSVLNTGSDFVYHIRVASEDNPEVSIFIFKGSEDEVMSKLRPIRENKPGASVHYMR